MEYVAQIAPLVFQGIADAQERNAQIQQSFIDQQAQIVQISLEQNGKYFDKMTELIGQIAGQKPDTSADPEEAKRLAIEKVKEKQQKFCDGIANSIAKNGESIRKMADERNFRKTFIPEEDIKISFDTTARGNALGSGVTGSVWRGTVKGIRCAFKELPKYTKPEPPTFDGFDVHHKNIANTVGFAKFKLKPKQLFYVTEYITGQDLGTMWHLASKRRQGKRLDKIRINLAILSLVENGMAYLHHEYNMAHKSLKPSNIMIYADNRVKITDVGIVDICNKSGATSSTTSGKKASSQITVGNETHVITNETNILWYQAPEIMNKLELNDEAWKKCDVYSFAVMLYQAITLKPLLWQNLTDQQLIETITNGQRLKLSERFLKKPWVSFSQIITNCWEGDPTKRPCFKELVAYQQESNREKLEITGSINQETTKTPKVHIRKTARQGRVSRFSKNK